MLNLLRNCKLNTPMLIVFSFMFFQNGLKKQEKSFRCVCLKLPQINFQQNIYRPQFGNFEFKYPLIFCKKCVTSKILNYNMQMFYKNSVSRNLNYTYIKILDNSIQQIFGNKKKKTLDIEMFDQKLYNGEHQKLQTLHVYKC